MHTEFINPNLHVILIHYPLALLTLGTLIELFSFLWRRSSFRAAGRWMILLGALSLVPTATLGLYAMWDVNRKPDTAMDATWEQVRAESPVQKHAWEMMQEHAWYTALGSAVILLLVVSYLAASDTFRRRGYPLYMLLLLGGLGAITLGAWHGGEMIYRHGVAVEPDASSEEEEHVGGHRIEYYAPPLQVHVMLAGLAVALGLASIGLSFRAGTRTGNEPLVDQYGYPINPALRPPDPTATAAQLSYPDPAVQQAALLRQPVSRFWLLGALLGLLTAGAGFWVMAQMLESWKPQDLWEEIQRSAQDHEYRQIAHVAVGVSLVVLMLVLAVIARAAAGRRFLIALFVLLFLGLASAQIWLGSLLLFDTSMGSVTKFNTAGAATTTRPSIEHEKPSTAPTTAPSTTRATAPIAADSPAAHSPAHGPG